MQRSSHRLPAYVFGLSLSLGVLALPSVSHAQGHEAPFLPPQGWSFDGLFGTFDRASMQRGFQVYKEVCSNCHSMKQMYYRNLTGIGLSEEQVKAVAAGIDVTSGTDDAGNPVQHPAAPSDRFRAPYADEKAARAANGGALPPDQSLIIKAREHGPDYVFWLMQGYRDAPAGVKVGDGQYYNEYFPGGQLAMSQPLHDGAVTYADGTPATVVQMSRDIVQFLTWTANQEMEQRKRMGVKVVLFLILMTGLAIATKKAIWKDVH